MQRWTAQVRGRGFPVPVPVLCTALLQTGRDRDMGALLRTPGNSKNGHWTHLMFACCEVGLDSNIPPHSFLPASAAIR